MSNHVHLVLVPADADGLRLALARAHRRYAASIGRPVGNKTFLARLERLSGRALQPAKRGPKPREPDPAQRRLV
jgi:hypothetical protein